MSDATVRRSLAYLAVIATVGHIAAVVAATVTFATTPPAGCEQAIACAAAPSTVYISSWVPGDSFVNIRRHELGHVFDYEYMTPGARSRFRHIMRIPAAAATASYNVPREWFAEGFRMCARSMTKPDWAEQDYGYDPTPAQHVAVCKLIVSVYGKTFAALRLKFGQPARK